MKIFLEQVTKRFRKQIIFRNVHLQFEAPNRYALLGANGSGKSTLLRTIAGMQMTTSGKVVYKKDNHTIPEENMYSQVSFCAPGMELIEELTLHEFFKFHFSFVPPLHGMSISTIIEATGLQNFQEKFIEEFSSGMKQRVKLAQAIFTNRPILLLDEPCTNLDAQGITQYNDWIRNYTGDKLLIIASNDPQEYHFCEHKIQMSELM